MTVLVVGNAVLDSTFEVPRLPLPGESILADAVRDDLGGKGLNQAVAAARAGAVTIISASVGDDQPAVRMRSRLTAEGISSDHLIANEGSSDRTTIFVMPDGENAIVTSALRSRAVLATDVDGAFGGLGPGDVLLMQGNLSHHTTLALAERATLQGMKVVLNPSPISFDYMEIWPHVAVSVLNEHECTVLSGRPDAESGAQYLRGLGVLAVVVTRGPRSVLIVDGSRSTELEVPKVEAVDTTGAGDVFCGVLAAGVEAGMDLAVSGRWAARAASIAVTRPGTTAATPTAIELTSMHNDRV